MLSCWGSCSSLPWQSRVWAAAMEPEPRKKAAAGHCWQSLLCLQPRRQKKKVAYSTYIRKLLNQVHPSWARVRPPAFQPQPVSGYLSLAALVLPKSGSSPPKPKVCWMGLGMLL